MKKAIIALVLLAVGAAAHADDTYSYLNIEKADGTTISLDAVGLQITYSGSSLVAVSGSESATIALADLSRMYFSNTNAGTAGIDAPTADQLSLGEADEIYDLQGRRVDRRQLRTGVYIIKKNGKTAKMQVKR